MGKYDGLAKIIVRNVGGKENITGLAHCITRLRFRLADESKAQTDVLKQTDGVVTVAESGGHIESGEELLRIRKQAAGQEMRFEVSICNV